MTRTTKIVTALALGAVLVTARGATPQQGCPPAASFMVTKLPGVQGVFGIAETEGTDINDAGQISGLAFVETPVFAWRAVRWTLGATAPVVLTAGMGRTNGVSENNLVAGEDENGASVWDAANHQSLLPALPSHLRASASDVDANGVVVGWSMTATDIFPVAWMTPDGESEPIDLTKGVPNAANGLMRKINTRGVAVGEMSFFKAPFERAVTWNAATGKITILPGLRGFNNAEGDSTAMGLNDRGLIVGQSHRPLSGGTAAIIPVVWQRAQVRALPLGTFGGGTAHDANNCGTVVGQGIVNVFDVRAVIWQGETVRDLDTLHAGPHLGLTAAVAINNRGQILVTSAVSETYVLTPQP